MKDYYAIYELVEEISSNLETGRHHYRDRSGRLLTALDEVVRAIVDDDLGPVDEGQAMARYAYYGLVDEVVANA